MEHFAEFPTYAIFQLRRVYVFTRYKRTDRLDRIIYIILKFSRKRPITQHTHNGIFGQILSHFWKYLAILHRNLGQISPNSSTQKNPGLMIYRSTPVDEFYFFV